MNRRHAMWDAIDTAKYRDEAEAVHALLAMQPLSTADQIIVRNEAIALVKAARGAVGNQGLVEGFLQQYSLGSQEGLALMCLAEALLRTPDAATRDRLIAEKIGTADWESHRGQSDRMLVNASSWALMLTGRLIEVDLEAKRDFKSYVLRLVARVGEPVIRKAIGVALQMMGDQFVLGRSIDEALARAKTKGYLCSFDILGEGARTAEDAERYEHAYTAVIETVGTLRTPGDTPERGHGVSVKLSALCPRFEAVQETRVWDEPYPRLKRLALIAARHDLNFTIDAEEADGLVLSLKLVDRLANDTDLGQWSTTPQDIDDAVALARREQPAWDRLGGIGRGRILRAMSDSLELATDRLVALLAREAGKTLGDAVAEVREAIDFCRYYADQAELKFATPLILPGPVGESNQLELRGRGVFVCISPWNFPLAIFTGQIAAGLAAGNAVLAKPAEQTPLVAIEAVRLFHGAGLPAGLVALLPGDGDRVGAALVDHPGIDGVAFTGGTDTAWRINRSLAARPGPIVPLIAETGGLNAMFVDTTALREQVVDDVLLSAFGSAGQRCSALRMLFLPIHSPDAIIATLIGALQATVIGNPAHPATDIGPVIDAGAHAALEAHVERLQREALVLYRHPVPDHLAGSYFGPVVAEVPSPDFLDKEVFGPVLHIFRYDPADLESVARRLAGRGYGLTLGVHSRIDAFADTVRALVPAGNTYVNRSIIGAVVGVQPFGGEGLSGTGPKAGGPNALLRHAVERSLSVNITAQGGNPTLLNL